jgi:SAM-dependent methyltransferase
MRLIKIILKRLLKSIKKQSDFLTENKKKKIKKCYICGEQFESFSKYRINKENTSIVNYFQLIGSDSENFGCYYCNSNDRERHLFMFFDKLAFWDKFINASVLHFAPEKHLSEKIMQLNPSKYIKCDLFPQKDWKKVDITKIDFEDNHFDILICNHVLEHVPDHLLALKEIARVLKKNGVAIMQTPYSELFYNHFEDLNINTDHLRLLFYGQEDHVRIISKRQFIDELSRFFIVNIIINNRFFSDEECFKYGVNKKEDLLMVINNKGLK